MARKPDGRQLAAVIISEKVWVARREAERDDPSTAHFRVVLKPSPAEKAGNLIDYGTRREATCGCTVLLPNYRDAPVHYCLLKADNESTPIGLTKTPPYGIVCQPMVLRSTGSR